MLGGCWKLQKFEWSSWKYKDVCYVDFSIIVKEQTEQFILGKNKLDDLDFYRSKYHKVN